MPKHEEKQHGDDQAHLKQERQVAQKNHSRSESDKAACGMCLGKKNKKKLKYKRVYFVWNSVWVGFQGRGPSSNHSHRLSVVSMLWLITVTFSVCSSLRVNVCQKKQHSSTRAKVSVTLKMTCLKSPCHPVTSNCCRVCICVCVCTYVSSVHC